MINQIFKKIGVWLGIFALAALLGLPVWNALADSAPKFNQMPGDEEFLTGRNVTQNESAYVDPVAATDGETVEVRVWYHNNASNENGDPGTSAVNTTVKISLPTGDNTSHIITGSIGADNAPTVTGTFVDGKEVGRPGLTINSPLPTNLAYVPGTVRWHPNGSTTAVPLPGGQSGDELITGTGINLGDIQGCWQFAGMVKFQVRLNAAGAPNLVRSKAAYNETQKVLAPSTPAKEGDIITYGLRVDNTGTRPEENFIITDDIRDVLQYANFLSASDNGVLQNGSIIYPAATVPAGGFIAYTFKVQIKPVAEWPTTGDFVLTNVYGNQVDVPIKPPVNQPGITIAKTVQDASGAFVEEALVAPDKKVTFRVVIRNTGDVVLTNVALFDLPQNGLEYVKGSTTVERDGRTFAVADDLITAGGLKLTDSVKPGDVVTLHLQLKVPAGAAHGSRLVNTAVVRSDQTTEQRDDAVVIPQVAVTPPVTQPAGPTPVTPGPKLPTTGAGDAGLILAGLSIGGATSVRYWQAKRRLARAAGLVQA